MALQLSRPLMRLAGVLIVAMAMSARTGLAQEPFPGIDAYITKAMADWKVPGLAVAIVRGDSVIYAKGYGVRKVGTADAVNDRTLFEIGSSSKSFTATVVAMIRLFCSDPMNSGSPRRFCQCDSVNGWLMLKKP